MLRKYKKGQIGATLSWFVAILIIFFIIILFLAATLIFSAGKKVFSGSDKIALEKRTGNLMSYDILLNLLDRKIIFENEKSSIKNIIIKGFAKEERTKIKERLKEDLDKTLKESYGGAACYLLDINYGGSNLDVNNNFDVCSFTCTDKSINAYLEQYKLRLISKSINFDIYSAKGIIKIKFYLGDC